MKQLSPYEVMQNEVNRIAQEVSDPAQLEFSPFFAQATAVLASYGDQNQAMNATLCAYALKAMSEEDRATFMAAFEIPGRVYQQLAQPDAWPFAPQEAVTDGSLDN